MRSPSGNNVFSRPEPHDPFPGHIGTERQKHKRRNRSQIRWHANRLLRTTPKWKEVSHNAWLVRLPVTWFPVLDFSDYPVNQDFAFIFSLPVGKIRIPQGCIGTLFLEAGQIRRLPEKLRLRFLRCLEQHIEVELAPVHCSLVNDERVGIPEFPQFLGKWLHR